MNHQKLIGHAHVEFLAGLHSSTIRLVRDYLERTGSEQAEARRRAIKRRHMLCEYHQEMCKGMPLQEKLNMGIWRC